MTTKKMHAIQFPDYMNKLLMGLAVLSILLLTPFAINNFVQGRLLLGLGSASIVLIFALNAWSITQYERYYPTLILFGIVPAILFFLTVSLRSQGIIGVLWCFPAVISFYFMLPEKRAWLANAALLLVTCPFVWAEFPVGLAVRILITLTISSVLSAIFVNVITEQRDKLMTLAITDPLTGLLNRVSFSDSLSRAVDTSHRLGTPMTLVALDLDHFKQVNDELGHDAGDAVLCDVAILLRAHAQPADQVFRLGGEEFLMLLHGSDLERSRILAEEVRSAISRLQTLPGRPVTASLGMATLEPSEGWQQWMKRSDDNLYLAKEFGRNQVAV